MSEYVHEEGFRKSMAGRIISLRSRLLVPDWVRFNRRHGIAFPGLVEKLLSEVASKAEVTGDQSSVAVILRDSVILVMKRHKGRLPWGAS